MRVLREERGLAGTVLIIVIAWALAAVLMLTGTLVSAQQIDDSVAQITTSVSEIDRDTDAVNVLFETRRIAHGIRDAAAPLTGQLDRVVGSVERIDNTVPRILNTAGQINTTAKSINGVVRSIGGTVGSIHGAVGAILAEVRQIEPGVALINLQARDALGPVRGIRRDLARVHRPLAVQIRQHAASIDRKLPEALEALAGVGGN